MSNRNATASWSGYSHQGQVGLLLALRKLQEVPNRLAIHFLEYEICEDIAIYKREIGAAKEYLSVHQVKAYYSAGNNTKAKYHSVLNDSFKICGNDFLHTVVSISDWNTSDTPNINQIQRFIYSEGISFCDVTGIEPLLKTELRLILATTDEGRVSNALNRLIYFLDCKIRQEHKKRTKALFDVSFSFKQINEIIQDNTAFETSSIFKIRKNYYDEFINKIKEQNFNEDHINLITKSIIDPIYHLSNEHFLFFLQSSSLDVRPEKIKDFYYIFNLHGVRLVFFKSLLEIIVELPIIEEFVVKYQIAGQGEKFVLTTITQDQDQARNVVENILKNCISQNIFWDNHALINQSIEGNLSTLNPSIMNIEAKGEENKFMSYSFHNRLIKMETAKSMLNHE